MEIISDQYSAQLVNTLPNDVVLGGVPMVQWYIMRDYLDLDVLTVTGVRSATTRKCSINLASLPATTVTSAITKSRSEGDP